MAAQAPDGVAVALPAEVHGFAVVGRPDSQSAAVSPPPEVMQVQCPPGVSEGMPVQVTAPSGVMMQVQVPPNITEGMTFGVSLPPAAPLAVYQISGDRYSVINYELKPGERVQAEAGAMMYMSPGVAMSTNFAGWRLLAGEGLFKNTFTNSTQTTQWVGIAPNLPMSIIVPLDMSSVTGSSLNCKRGVWLAGHDTVRVMPKILPAQNCAACCCGGMPPIIQELSGTGNAFLSAAGTVVKKELEAGQVLLVDSDSVVAFDRTVEYDVRSVGNCRTCCLGGEGCFNTKLTGPGAVYLQTISYEKLRRLLVTEHSEGDKSGGGGDGGAPLLTPEKMFR